MIARLDAPGIPDLWVGRAAWIEDNLQRLVVTDSAAVDGTTVGDPGGGRNPLRRERGAAREARCGWPPWPCPGTTGREPSTRRRAARWTRRHGAGCRCARSSHGRVATAKPSGPACLEDDIIDMLPPTMRAGGQVYTPYSCLAFDIRADGTEATDIEHIVALAEAHVQRHRGRPAPGHRGRPGQPHDHGPASEPDREERPGRRRVDAGPARRVVCRARHRRQARIRVVGRPEGTGRAGSIARRRRGGS